MTTDKSGNVASLGSGAQSQLEQRAWPMGGARTAAKPLVPIAAFFVLGLFFGERFSYFPVSVLCSLIAGIILWRWVRVSSILPGLIFIPLLFGFLYYQSASRFFASSDLSPYLDRDLVTFEGTLEDPVRHYPDRLIGVLSVNKIFLQGEERRIQGRVRLSINWPEPGFLPGDIVRVEAKLRSPQGFKNPGEFDYAEYLHREGIRAVSSVSHPERVLKLGQAPGVVSNRIAGWREKIRAAISNSLGMREAAILQAMIIGESGYLTNEIRDDFMASGTTHILSISGSHLGLVAFIMFLLVRRGLHLLPASVFLRLTVRFTPSQIAACATVFPVIFYALLAGPQPATVRSLIMILVYLTAVVLQREDDLLNALAFSAVLTLLWQPLAILDISFQLSYGSVLAMGLVLRWWNDRTEKEAEMTSRSRRIQSLILMLLLTLTTTVWTAPLVVYHFHQLAWVGLFSNLIIIPMAGFLIVPLGLVSSVLVLIFHLERLPFAWLNQHALMAFDGLVRIFSSLPAAEFHLPSPSILMIVLFYLLLFFLFRTEKIRTSWLLGGSQAIALVLLAVWGLLPRLPDSILHVSYLDVGQGDSALVEFPEGQTMVIDGGGAFGDFDLGRIVVAPYLWNRRIRRIDYLVASHPQQDHMGGLAYLLKKFEVGEVWTNGTRRDSLAYRIFSQALDQKGLKEREMFSTDETVKIGGSLIGVLNPVHAPDGDGSGYRSKADNNRSIVLRLEKGDQSFLFAGDIETEAEKMLAALEGGIRSKVLKVPHHGSRGALDEEFLRQVHPDIAVVSVGAHNSYGHPAPEVIEAYRRSGSKIYRTDQEGAIMMNTNGKEISVRTDRDLRLAPVEFRADFVLEEWANIKRVWAGF